MDTKCKELQLLLMDIHYGEGKMSEKVREHLAECIDCQVYWQEIQELKGILAPLDFDPDISHTDIDNALLRGKKRETVFELFQFVVVGLIYLVMVFLVSKRVNPNYYFYYQGFLYLTLPLFSLPIFFRRIKKEDSHG